MFKFKKIKQNLLPVLFLMVLSTAVIAQEKEEAPGSAQANNPLANMTALNFHNYYMPKINDAPSDAYLNYTWIRFARPLSGGKLLLRVSVPMNTFAYPTGNSTTVSTTNGLGDINAFLAYSFISEPTATVGIGPNLTMNTATEDELGTGKWQAGFAFVAFISKSPVFQYGGLITWQTSIAGDDKRSKTNSAAIQPFYFWQLGKGTYLRGAPIWMFDLKNDTYVVPLALGIGKVVKVGDTVFNLFIEPEYSALSNGMQPQIQIFTGINLQFMGGN